MKNERSDAWIYEAFSRDAEIPASLDARLAETCETIRRESRGKDEDPMRKYRHRSVRTVLLIAAAVAVLSLSAFAVYQYSIRDALLPEEATAAEPSSASAESLPPAPSPAATESDWLRLSENGFSDSPEYRAYAEWMAWNDAWWAENPDPWAALGEDDGYYETSESYAHLYNAPFAEQAEKLDEIMKKYGLTPHVARCSFDTEEELCQILGAADLFSDDYDVLGEYIYDDGSCKVSATLDGGGYDNSTEIFIAAKGSFSMIQSSIPADYSEWSYTTADGTTVVLATGRAVGTGAESEMTAERAYILAELDGAYLNAGFYGGADAETLERWADGIDFAALNAVFVPAGDRTAVAAAVEARAAEETAAMAAEAATMYAPFADRAARDAAVFEELGHYTIGALPAGYVFLYDSAEWKSVDAWLLWDGDEETALSTATFGGITWKGDDSDGIWRFLHLSYQRYYDRHDLETVTNEIEFEKAKEYYRAYSGECTDTEVNGYEAILVRDEWGTPDSHLLIWFDTDRGLQFTLSGECFNEDGNVDVFTDAELVAMAESVTEG